MKGLFWLLFTLLLGCQAVVAPLNALAAGDAAGTRQKTLTGPSDERVEVALRRQLAYGLTLYDGEQYQATFCPEEIDTIYMRANVDNVIMASVTDVYFWPLTKEYMADWLGTNERQRGYLEIRQGNKVVKTLSCKKYTLRYPEGPLGKATALMVLENAEAAARDYEEDLSAYYRAMEKYYQDYMDYSRRLAGSAGGPEARGGESPVEPAKPKPPAEYVMDPNEGFIVNLPPGTYQMQLKDPGGKAVPHSRRRLVSFPVLRTGTGFDLFPEDKWTYPTRSDDLSQSILSLGNRVLYLQPYAEEQYNAHHHLKLTQLSFPASGRGMRSRKTWVHIAPLAHELTLEILRGSEVVSRVREKPYSVKQRPGYALGYEIVEFAAGESPGEAPTFSAYRLETPNEAGRYRLRLVDPEGRVVPGSLRNLHTVPRVSPIVLAMVASLPLGLGLAAAGRRAHRSRRSRATAG